MNLRHSVLSVVMAGALPAAWAAQAEPGEQPATSPTTPATVTLVNLHLNQALPQTVFAELAKQGGIRITADADLWQRPAMQEPLDVDFSNRPFWLAVRDACRMCSLQIRPVGTGGGRSILLSPTRNSRASQPRPVCESNGCVIEAVAFAHRLSVNYVEPDVFRESCGLELMVYMDPALLVRKVNANIRADQAVDDQGNSMLADKPGDPSDGYLFAQALVCDCTAALKYPASVGKKIADFKCTLSLQNVDKSETLTIDQPLDAAETSKDFAGTTITFESLQRSAQGGYELKAHAARANDRAPNEPAYQLFQAGQLLDVNGRAFHQESISAAGNNCTIRYSRNGDAGITHGQPVKWIIELPTQVHVMMIPVEFKDLVIH